MVLWTLLYLSLIANWKMCHFSWKQSILHFGGFSWGIAGWKVNPVMTNVSLEAVFSQEFVLPFLHWVFGPAREWVHQGTLGFLSFAGCWRSHVPNGSTLKSWRHCSEQYFCFHPATSCTFESTSPFSFVFSLYISWHFCDSEAVSCPWLRCLSSRSTCLRPL